MAVKKAKTVSCKEAVTKSIRQAAIIKASTKECININIHTPANAKLTQGIAKNAIYTAYKPAAVISKTSYNCNINNLNTKISKHASNDLKLNELFLMEE